MVPIRLSTLRLPPPVLVYSRDQPGQPSLCMVDVDTMQRSLAEHQILMWNTQRHCASNGGKSTPSGLTDKMVPSGWMASTALSQLTRGWRLTNVGGIRTIPIITVDNARQVCSVFQYPKYDLPSGIGFASTRIPPQAEACHDPSHIHLNPKQLSLLNRMLEKWTWY